MNFSDEAKLTAYALGELDGDERAAVEARLRGDPAAQAAVAEIRATAVRLEAALAGEPVEADPEVRERRPRARRRRWARVIFLGGGLAAACVAAVITLRPPPPVVEVAPVAKPVNRPVATARKPAAENAPVGASEVKAVPATTAPEPKIEMPAGSQKISGLRVDVASADVTKRPELAPAEIVAKAEAVFAEGHAAVGTVPPFVPSAPLAPEPAGIVKKDEAGELVVLSPFKVEAAQATRGYTGSNTLAGTRGRSNLSDIGSFNKEVRRSPQLASMRAPTGRPQAYGMVGVAAGTAMTWGMHRPPGDTEAYSYRADNTFLTARENPLSTFSADVDTASYANVRRFIEAGRRPPVDAVRIEELVNYFPYRYQAPRADGGRGLSPAGTERGYAKAPADQRGGGTALPSAHPFAATMEVAEAPWAAGHRLVRIGLKGREVAMAARGAANLVFLLDVSGSMNQPNKLPLVKESLHLLLGRLRADDRVAIVTYAGASGLALASTPVAKAHEIAAALDELQPEGSTNGAMGIQLAYDIAKANFVSGGINRVILCTDGDFNVGVTSEGELVRLIKEKAKTGVFLTVLGFGMGNYKDATLQQLADAGNGNYGYIDTRREAEKLLVEQVSSTLVTIAKDVKLQVEFNPAQVTSYRLIGYEKRMLRKEDFNNDAVDAGEIGSGHAVTALYEIVPAGASEGAGAIDPLKYSTAAAVTEAPSSKIQAPGNQGKIPNAKRQTAEPGTAAAAELLTLKVRYKEPAGEVSRKLEFPLVDGGARFAEASDDFQFAAAVAAFGMVLRESPEHGTATLADVAQWAEAAAAADPGGYRAEFVALVRKAERLP